MPAATFLAAVLLLLLDLLLLGCVELQSQGRKQAAMRNCACMLVACAAATILHMCYLSCDIDQLSPQRQAPG
jgi:hypothetical protein